MIKTDSKVFASIDELHTLWDENTVLKATIERLIAENRELRALRRRHRELLYQCVGLSKRCFPKKDYNKESLFKILDQIYLLASSVDDDDIDTSEKGGEDES